jgi:hypothetical protein
MYLFYKNKINVINDIIKIIKVLNANYNANIVFEILISKFFLCFFKKK